MNLIIRLHLPLVLFALALIAAGAPMVSADGDDSHSFLPEDNIVYENPINITDPTDDIVIEVPDDDAIPGIDDHIPDIIRDKKSIPENVSFTRTDSEVEGISKATTATIESSPSLVANGIGTTTEAVSGAVPDSAKEQGTRYSSMVHGMIRGPGGKIVPRLTAEPSEGRTIHISANHFIATTMVGMIIMGFAAAVSSRKGNPGQVLPFIAPLYSRISRDEVLENDTRGSIYSLIANNPGMDLLTIKTTLGLSNGVIAHHIHTLERERYLRSVRDGRYRRFFVTGSKVEMVNSIESHILTEIETKPYINQSQIARNLGLSRQALNYHIKKLVKKGTIVTEKIGRETIIRRGNN